GAVLPGVTVEAGSPVLIEKTRTAITDATGQFRFESLPPRTYTVTFTLSGFSTVKRQSVDVSGAGVITINTELHVGAVSETVTVTGETPIVDVQSARHQQVLDDRGVSEIPARPAPNPHPPLPSPRAPAEPRMPPLPARCGSSRATADVETRDTCRSIVLTL